MTRLTATFAALALLATAACVDTASSPQNVARWAPPDIIRAGDKRAPANAPAGSCWGREVTPAVLETVTEQILVRPAKMAEDGTVVSPARYRTEKQQRIVQERAETWFESPCPQIWTRDFTESVQRALQARGLFNAPITGQYDPATRTAIRQYQQTQGLNSEILSLENARSLGLIAVARENK